MATGSEINTIPNREEPNKPLTMININSVIKLTSSNYLLWKAQLEALLVGYDLHHFVDGSVNPPSATIVAATGPPTRNPAYTTWIRQDKLLFGALAGTLSPSLGSLITRASTSKEAWDILANTYALPSRGHVKQLKFKLKHMTKGATPVSEYMQNIKSITDELAMLGTIVPPEDITDKIVDGLDARFQSVIDAIHACDTPISFEELHEKLINKELAIQTTEAALSNSFPATANPTYSRSNYTHRSHHQNPNRPSNQMHFPNQNPKNPFKGRCQWCNVTGHTLTYCPTFKDLHPAIRIPRHSRIINEPPQVNVTAATNRNPASAHSPWLLDNGASHHVTTDLSNLSLHHPYDGTDEIVIGDGSGLPISHTSSTHLSSPTQKFTLSNVLFVPSMHKNIISASKFCRDNKAKLEFSPFSFCVKDLHTGAPLLTGPTKDGIYYWPASTTSPQANVLTKKDVDLHHRFGHPSFNDFPCNSCYINKSHKLPFGTSSLTTSAPLEVIFSDVWSSPIYSLDGYKYYVIFVDHFTKYIWLYPIKRKSDTTNTFIYFKALFEKKFGRSILTLYSDNGGEFQALASFLATHGVSHLTSPPHTPEHNGYAERRHLHIVETSLALLSHASMPLIYWPHAFQTTVYLINRMPTPTLNNTSPYFKLFGSTPKYTHLHNFGCLCYPWLRPYASHKLAPRSIACAFLVYSPTPHAYLCLDPTTNRLYSSRHVRFVEMVYPFSQLTPTPSSENQSPDSWCALSLPLTTLNPSSIESSNPPPSTSPPAVASTSNNHPTPSAPVDIPISTSQPVHTYRTMASNNIYKPIHKLNLSAQRSTPEPTSLKQALADPKWREAMPIQHQALITNHTWDLVPVSPSQNIIGSKWVFRTKYNSDGSFQKHKARLVALGFHQRPGLDYNETFSPVIKPATVRLLLSLVVTNGWTLRQLDINDAFLQGTLSDDVYMAQPPGFVDPEHPDHVCRLRKAIYVLKQAPRAWYTELRTHLLSIGFINSVSDTSLFIQKGTKNLFVLVYVDDIIVTGPCPNEVSDFISSLSVRFSLKDLGHLSYFLGVEVQTCSHGLFLSQRKYIIDLLARAKMLDAKPMPTPMESNTRLTLAMGTPLDHPKDYRALVGSLQYLALTRPDIAFAVNKLSQFMHCPTTTHWQALKRLIRYLKGSLDKGINIYRNSPLKLHAFSDSDWAGDKTDYISTGAYIVYLGQNPISWSSKKQRSVSRSSTEAEYRAIAQAASELAWLGNIMLELGISSTTTPTIYCDNIGAVNLSSNPVFHSRMKHLAIDYYFIREKVQAGALHVTPVVNDDQLADALTKPLSRPRLHMLLSKIGLTSRPSILRGHDKNP
ncbi:hypothetical protein OSB04_010497 [Centaurea solstitialis]|uniref:Integrase catalytic domain-containing protein n=1 Tax=Centaurea solstitialis TaxID=347529 RepID=A0AA38T7P4_9ASTR|nr:hypothetical protein OSB04_010497 [Centaurea solstitialis]